MKDEGDRTGLPIRIPRTSRDDVPQADDPGASPGDTRRDGHWCDGSRITYTIDLAGMMRSAGGVGNAFAPVEADGSTRQIRTR